MLSEYCMINKKFDENKTNRKEENKMWLTEYILGRWVEAKIYQRPSMLWGINDGRVSVLSVAKEGPKPAAYLSIDTKSEWDYAYNRRLWFDNLHTEVLNAILEILENSPRFFVR